MLNPFTATGFDMAALTAAINRIPVLYGRLAELGMFGFEGVTTTTVQVEQINGTLNIVRSRPRGAPADVVIADKRALRSFAVPHIPLDDVLLPEDFQNVREFGTENSLESQASILVRKLQKMRNALDQTLEYLRMGALKGIILDADGSTLFNLYTEFTITAKAVNFALVTPTTDVIKKCHEVKRHIEKNLRGERMTGIRALCSEEFFDALVTHASVEDAFRFYSVNNQSLADDKRRGFRFGGIIFEEYVASWTDKDATARRAIAANEAHFFPEGTGETFKTIAAPGNFLETANTIGLPFYAKQEERKFGQGLDMHAEMNPLPICLRPEILVKGTNT